ncbi:hypothetical protein BBI01_09505 [Chryseobacterium artocarpi]|uniref:Uncharacterized protein n=1 Tax=Chryseobacterium artocarpi TaxID=1414727 RepID=A0A1B8ZL83_9FLAO|nr:hypothetical protein BBI01_09505 [Chryseobacterium artocarpi]
MINFDFLMKLNFGICATRSMILILYSDYELRLKVINAMFAKNLWIIMKKIAEAFHSARKNIRC